ncbi:MAG TPA: sulfotransferase domain-containing protein [Nocardioides sp.]|uniref:sulfotransferase domain-containing protein n=1 Tax=Nocardioides sp. TaxID=35761 RepID=UPI002E36626C|nr:sulfotransferase domain-containing protein [Nocardioides sp.]HEX5086730.1 sulfotransferase domain-containing protein [Nocardioides sp.]
MTRRYVSDEEDSDRWNRFPFREGDVVVSTRSKSGTTWVQQICLLLLHGTPDLPAPLGELSPWVDWLTIPEDDLFARLEAQPGRRVVKTHTPLDGVVIDPRATYIVVVRDPLDMAVSLYHQGDNLDRERIAELTGRPYAGPVTRPPVDEWLRVWTQRETDPMVSMDSLQGVVHHAADAADRRDDRRVLLLRYEDLVADLAGWMGRLAEKLGVDVDPEVWPALVESAGFGSMRADAAARAPDRRGVLKDPAAFFRRGRPGEGREVLSRSDVAAYEERVRRLVDAESPSEPAEVLRLLGVPPAP